MSYMHIATVTKIILPTIIHTCNIIIAFMGRERTEGIQISYCCSRSLFEGTWINRAIVHIECRTLTLSVANLSINFGTEYMLATTY